MQYRILADLIVVLHFVWILFMLLGFILTLRAFFIVYILRTSAGKWKTFFDRWLFRLLHLFGIVYVGSFALLGKYCPLTILENNLRQRYNPQISYTGSFIVHYIEKLVYPGVNPLIILIPTIFIAVFTILVFLIRPPAKIKEIFC